YISNKTKKISVLLLALVVLSYQFAGSLTQLIITGSFEHVYSSFIIGIPGMVLQIVFGFAILLFLKDYEFKNDK
ncbi:MAG: hypothetical protein P4L27_00190, partial [Ignavibacteriaceae bacterium]|nr:hypothetical protein [Ignavibacteriaceae bacterium]